MKSVSTYLRAFVATTALCASFGGLVASLTLGVAHAADDKTQKVGEKVGKPLKAAQEAIQKKQFDVATAKIKEADAVAKKTPFEQFSISEMTGYLDVSQQKYGEAAVIYEKLLESSQFLSPQQASVLMKTTTQLFFNGKQYPKSIEFSKRWLKDHPTDIDIVVLLGQAYYIQNDFKQAREQMMAASSLAEKSGQEPKEMWLEVAYSSSVKLSDEAGITATLEKLVRYHPKADYWDRLLDRESRNEKSDRVMFQWYRLMFDAGILKRPDSFMEYSQQAMSDFAMPGEAVRVLEAGFKQQILGANPKDKERHERLLAKAKDLATKDKAQLPQLEKESQGANATAGSDMGLGLDYFSYEQYDQAIPMLERALKKGGLKFPDDAKITLGIAQLKKGQKDQARSTLKSIAADSPMAKVASMWVLRSYN